MLIKRFKSIFHPEYFHGWGNRKRFFEGFYFKLVDFKEENCVVIIAGIAVDKFRKVNTFIQILDGEGGKLEHHSYDENYRVKNSLSFELQKENIRISKDSIELNFPNANGAVSFSSANSWSKKWYSPGAMGPFTFLPYLECYHGVLSMQSDIHGELNLNGRKIDFSKGKAYLEKDWGHSFPKEYIWVQCNHFKTSNTSLTVSLARTKYFGRTFLGFLVGMLFQGKLIEFTTYNFSKVINQLITNDYVQLTFENKNYRLEIKTNRIPGTKLFAPIHGEMIGQVSESISGIIDLVLFDKRKNQIVFHENGTHVGLEVEWENKK